MRIPKFVVATLAALLPLLPSCSGSATDSASTAGKASFVLTDAVNDELEFFEVDLTALTLEPVSGNNVNVLTKATRIDFTSLSEISDLVAAVDVPLGLYKGVILTFDFSTASVLLKDKTSAASIVGADQSALTGTMTVPVRFATASRPQVIASKNHLFMLDLDLEQALTIDATNNRVTFAPVVKASFDPTSPKPVVVYGALKSIDVARKSFMLERRSKSGSAIATIEVRPSTSTVFQVDGVGTTGLSSFSSLSNLSLNTAMIRVFGSLDTSTRVLNATSIEIGSGIPGDGQDRVSGWITARTGAAGADATLTIRGRSFRASNGSRTFNQNFTVNTSFTNTKVVQRGNSTARNTNALNIGQHVTIYGSLSGTTLTATTTDGVARMHPTSIFGTANAAPSGNVITLNLARIGIRPIGDFNFTVSTVSEANPAAYTITSPALNNLGVTTGSKIEARGFVNAVGIPSDQNFASSSTRNRTNSRIILDCRWFPASSTAITTTGDSSLTLDVSGAATKKLLDGFGGSTLNNSPAPTITGLPASVFVLVTGATVEVHKTFSAFSDAVEGQLNNGAKVLRISGLGTYVSITQSYLANLVTVVLTAATQ